MGQDRRCRDRIAPQPHLQAVKHDAGDAGKRVCAGFLEAQPGRCFHFVVGPLNLGADRIGKHGESVIEAADRRGGVIARATSLSGAIVGASRLER
jgi:hypothetical protein